MYTYAGAVKNRGSYSMMYRHNNSDSYMLRMLCYCYVQKIHLLMDYIYYTYIYYWYSGK